MAPKASKAAASDKTPAQQLVDAGFKGNMDAIRQLVRGGVSINETSVRRAGASDRSKSIDVLTGFARTAGACFRAQRATAASSSSRT
jgi:hypothetical protein